MPMQSVRRIILLLLTLILLNPHSAAQTAKASVGVANEPPHLSGLFVTRVYESNFSQILWCCGIAKDRNGLRDLSHFNATISKLSPGKSGKTIRPALIGFTPTSDVEGLAIFGFVLPPAFERGEYRCDINITDLSGYAASEETLFDILPPSCKNKIKDGIEEDIDCGGGCIPCTCYNHLLDEGEEQEDCGGLCESCANNTLQIQTVKEAMVGESIVIYVYSKDGKVVKSIVRAITPESNLRVDTTNVNGSLSMVVDSPGVWELKADAYGYKPAVESLYVKPSYIKDVLYAAVAIAAACCIIYYLWRKRRRAQKQASSS